MSDVGTEEVKPVSKSSPVKDKKRKKTSKTETVKNSTNHDDSDDDDVPIAKLKRPEVKQEMKDFQELESDLILQDGGGDDLDNDKCVENTLTLADM